MSFLTSLIRNTAACCLLLNVSTGFNAVAATITWSGGGGNANWTDPQNWQPQQVPGINDVAVFDGTNVSDASISAAVSVQGLHINSGFTGKITQLAGKSLTVGVAGFSQSDGNFKGLDAFIDVNGPLTLTAGGFIATTANLSVSGDVNIASGVYSHNGGTLTLDGSTQTIAINATLAILTKTVSAADTLTVVAGSGISVSAQLNLQGASGQILSLVSSSQGSTWSLNLMGGATANNSNLFVTDSDASSGQTISSSFSCGSNTTNWSFTGCTAPLQIINQVWNDAETMCLASSPIHADCGLQSSVSVVSQNSTILTIVIFVRNTKGTVANDVRILETVNTGAFTYQAGSLMTTLNDNSASQPGSSQTSAAIVGAISQTQTDVADVDYINIDTSVQPNKVTIGGVLNATLNIPANKTFAAKYKVQVQ